MLLEQTKTHFDADMARADAILGHARRLTAGALRDDLFRAAWMMAVGATDAVFSNAYADLGARMLEAKAVEPSLRLPGALDPRLAWDEDLARQGVLSLRRVKSLLRRFCRRQNILLVANTVEPWITHPDATARLWGITAADYLALADGERQGARQSGLRHFERRIDTIFRRRNDCIHACDRSLDGLQPLNGDLVEQVLADLRFLVERCFSHMVLEFPAYLTEARAPGRQANARPVPFGGGAAHTEVDRREQ
jgi:hypothetical protein